ncbi:MAG: hypothetical protein V1729_06000 [Candidatus Woesearchaeota archaeon]
MPAKKVKKNSKVPEEDTAPVRDVRRRTDCPDCGSSNIKFDIEMEQMVCHDCGVLFAEMPEGSQRPGDDLDFL